MLLAKASLTLYASRTLPRMRPNMSTFFLNRTVCFSFLLKHDSKRQLSYVQHSIKHGQERVHLPRHRVRLVGTDAEQRVVSKWRVARVIVRALHAYE